MRKLAVLFLILIITFQTSCNRTNPGYERQPYDDIYSDISDEGPDKTSSSSVPDNDSTDIDDPPEIPSPEETPLPTQPSEGIILSSNPVRSPDNIIIAEITDDGSDIMVLEISSDGSIENEVFRAPMYTYFPSSIKDQMLFLSGENGLFLYDLNGKALIELPESETCYPAGFMKQRPYVVYSNGFNGDLKYMVTIYDYVNDTIVRKFSGYNAKISVLDDSVYFLNYYPEDYYYSIAVSSFDPDTDELEERHKEMMDDYTFDIIDVVPLSKDFFAYCIYDEHEYRYNTSEGYVIATKGNLYSEDIKKEQFDFVFSPDGKMACMTERDWGALTYLAYGDYTSQEMFQSEYYGSFPLFHNGLIYFVSDPGFVNAKKGERQFRQISKYALYSLDPQKNEISEIYRCNGDGFMILERY